MKKTVAKRHLAINVQGILENYRRRSMAGLVTNDDGSKCTDAEARQFFYDHLKQGHTVIPTCDPKECPDFDYTGGGCPGHGIHYYDNNENEISKEEYDRILDGLNSANTDEIESDDDILI